MWTQDRNGSRRWIDLEREAAWAAYADELEHLLEFKELRREFDEVRLALARRRIAALELQVKALELKYRPDQPRVPAGRREGGQWTIDGAGTPSAHPGRGSPSGLVEKKPPPPHRPGGIIPQHEPTPDLGALFGIGTADAAERPRPPKIYRVDVRDEDALGGHTIGEHVGKDDEYLLRRMRREQIKLAIGPAVLVKVTPRIGSFSSVQSANALTSSTLAQNSPTVDLVASGEELRKAVVSWFRAPTGKEAFANQLHRSGGIRPTYGVRTVIQHDPKSAKGYRVVSSFPINP